MEIKISNTYIELNKPFHGSIWKRDSVPTVWGDVVCSITFVLCCPAIIIVVEVVWGNFMQFLLSIFVEYETIKTVKENIRYYLLTWIAEAGQQI